MSADNGIYIGQFFDGQIRVIEAQAIDNLWYPDGENADYITYYFKNAPTFPTLEEAYHHAFKLETDILESDFPILEYGISTLTFSKPFSEYEKVAKDIE